MTASTHRTVTLPDGTQVSAPGMGTRHLGEHPDRRDLHVAALRTGVAIGLTG